MENKIVEYPDSEFHLTEADLPNLQNISGNDDRVYLLLGGTLIKFTGYYQLINDNFIRSIKYFKDGLSHSYNDVPAVSQWYKENLALQIWRKEGIDHRVGGPYLIRPFATRWGLNGITMTFEEYLENFDADTQLMLKLKYG